MIILGIVLLIVGWFIHMGLLEDLGVLFVIVGLLLWFIPFGGAPGEPGRRRRYY